MMVCTSNGKKGYVEGRNWGPRLEHSKSEVPVSSLYIYTSKGGWLFQPPSFAGRETLKWC